MKYTPTPKTASEKEILRGFLDNLRSTMVWKVDGLDDEQAMEPGVPSGTNLLGLIKHLAWTELYWFVEVFSDDAVEYPYPDDDPGADLRPELGDTIDDIVAMYLQHIARCNEILDAADLDDISRGDQNGEHFSLRWIVLHMIEETARHAGHADILREQIDAVTGTWPPLST